MAILLMSLYLIGLLALLAVVLRCVKTDPDWNLEQIRAYDKSHPPISDEQYLQKFEFAVDRDVALKVRRIIAEQTNYPREQIYPDATCADLGID